MIGKISKGKGFAGAIAYAMEKEGAQFLGTNCVAQSTDAQALAREMNEHARAERPNLKHPVLHVSLSAAPGEKLSDDEWRRVADAYRQKMGLSDVHYVLVHHTDRDHDHVHLIMSRVDFDGRTVSDSRDFIRQERALDEIEQQFGLVRVREEMRQKIREAPTVALDNLLVGQARVNADQLRRQVGRYIYDPDERARITAAILNDRNTIYLGTDAKGRDLYTTRAVLTEWQELRKDMEALTDRRTSTELVRERACSPIALNEEQKAAVKALTSNRGLVVITGYAGVGKSTLLGDAQREWEAQGKHVVGCALARKAVNELNKKAAIKSATVRQTLIDIARGKLTLTGNSVLVIDEAGMVDTPQMRALIRYARVSGAVVRLAGDYEQLRSIERGGSFNLARRLAGETVVTQVMRQADTTDAAGNVRVDRRWMREATVAFGQARAADAVRAYIDHDKVTWSNSKGGARAELVRLYVEAVDGGRPPSDILALAHERRDVAALNGAIREQMRERGRFGEERTFTVTQTERDRDGNVTFTGQAKLSLAAGDRIVCTRNSKKDELWNGDFGTVLSAGTTGIRVKFDDGRESTIDLTQYEDVQHGYAVTGHKSQGSDAGLGLALASRGCDSHLSSVIFTRHKEDFRVVVPRTDFEDEAHLVETLSRRPDEDGLDGFNLEDTDIPELESAYAAQRDELQRIHRELAARTAAVTQSRAQEDLWRSESEVTRRGANVVRMLPGGDLEIAGPGTLRRSVYGVQGRGDARELGSEMRGIQHSDHEPGEARPMSFAEIQRAMRDDIVRRGASAQTADLARRAAIEPDTLALSPTHTPSGGYHLVARSKATGTEYLLRDARGDRFQFGSAAEALEARNALREQAAAKLGKPSERPEKPIPDIREADTYHRTEEIAAEAKLAGVELRGPDRERHTPERPAPSDRALDLTDLAGRGPYRLRAVSAERGGYTLALVDSTSAVEPEVLTDAAGQPMSYESAEAAEQDVGRLIQRIEAREHDHERGGRGR